ncbi:VapE domain-containing protein [Brumimicrobium mesophilum]|uniref:VapE domain-containing protein n=1 Tax=Brumimicrobium mesophilum TaxID=392717 RepID=UPI000D14346F|nr:VapE domain-containing protein [Brumimicrobium mesophilum]
MSNNNENKSNQPPTQWELVENYMKERFDIKRNIVANTIEFIDKEDDNKKINELNEYSIYRDLKKRNIKFSINDLKAMLASDFVEEYNPFVNYFTSLKEYDPMNEPDYIEKLTSYLPVEKGNELAFKTQLKKMFVRSVACSLGVQLNKHCFVFVQSGQHNGKTTLLRWFCPPDLESYIAEDILFDKDSLIALCTNFIINLDELSKLSNHDINAIKSVMSKDAVKARLPYSARATRLIRRANFVASTNETEFLSDHTGNVRWIAFKLDGKIDFNYNKDIDINRIWAQAYYLFKGGFQHQLTREEIMENEERNVEFMQRSIEQELIQQYFHPANFPIDKQYCFKTTTEIKHILDQKTISNRITIRKVGVALKVLGYVQTGNRLEGSDYPVKGYYIKEK